MYQKISDGQELDMHDLTTIPASISSHDLATLQAMQAQEELSKGKKKKEKKEKDPLKPKKPMTSFLLYCQEKRELVKRLYPNITFQELTKKLGDMWKNAEVEEKKLYEEKAKAAKDDYMHLLDDYNSNASFVEKSPMKKAQEEVEEKEEMKKDEEKLVEKVEKRKDEEKVKTKKKKKEEDKEVEEKKSKSQEVEEKKIKSQEAEEKEKKTKTDTPIKKKKKISSSQQ